MIYNLESSFDEDRGVWVACAADFGFIEAEGDTQEEALHELARNIEEALG